MVAVSAISVPFLVASSTVTVSESLHHIVSPVAYSLKTIIQYQPQVRTNAPLPCSNVVMKRHVDTGATDKMTFEPWSALSHDNVASSALHSRSVLGTQTKGKQTGYYAQLKGRQCSAPKCARNTATTRFTTACPNCSSFIDRSLILFNCCSHDTLLHIGLPSCITTVPTMYENTFLWLQHHKGQQHKKEHKESRVHQQDGVPPTVRSHQGQIRKSKHIPWDENVVSSHDIDDVQPTDCVTDEFRFLQKLKKMMKHDEK